MKKKQDQVVISTLCSSGKPEYHVVAPRGWINDPCAPGFDPQTGIYHLFYQWNPNSHAWGDISWGHATSQDMIYWQHLDQEPALSPDQTYDCCGVFTGCLFPSGPFGAKDEISVFYSSVNHLPISWREPYTRGCEGLAMATSNDGGKTWQKHPENPILSEEPPNLHVTGFRDPFLAPWPTMDALRETPHKLYGLISGGIHDMGPRTFLYAVDPDNLTNWTYLHPLLADVPVNYRMSEKWAGDFGANWECTNFVTLHGAGDLHREVIIAGSEGGHERLWVTKYHITRPDIPRRIPRYPNWLFGRLVRDGNNQAVMSVEKAGLLDWGIYYAASSFIAPDGRNLVWGWIIEEDLTDELLAQKGWTGCMGVPREIFLNITEAVVMGFTSELESIKSLEVVNTISESNRSSSTVLTLGIRPLIELQQLRGELLFTHLPGSLKTSRICLSSTPLSCEIRATLHVFDTTTSISLVVRHDTEMSIRTSIIFRPQEETLSVEREHSVTKDTTTVNTCPEIGSHTLFRTSQETIEPLRLTVYLDRDVIEVFANDRFALSTRVYTDRDHTGVSLMSEGGGWVEDVQIWEMGTITAV